MLASNLQRSRSPYRGKRERNARQTRTTPRRIGATLRSDPERRGGGVPDGQGHRGPAFPMGLRCASSSAPAHPVTQQSDKPRGSGGRAPGDHDSSSINYRAQKSIKKRAHAHKVKIFRRCTISRRSRTFGDVVAGFDQMLADLPRGQLDFGAVCGVGIVPRLGGTVDRGIPVFLCEWCVRGGTSIRRRG